MVSIFSLLLVLGLSIVISRIAAVALTHTGLSKQSARFQARSAFTGVGFTTSESEKVMQHPVRRKILMLLMLMGNAGIVTAVASLILTGMDLKSGGSFWMHLALLISGLGFLIFVANSQFVDRHLSNLITWALKRYTDLDVKDYASILHVAGKFSVSEMQVQEGDWIANRTLRDLALNLEGVLVLGIERQDSTYLGAPSADTTIVPGDGLILYGKVEALQSLDNRKHGPEGDRDRRIAERRHHREEMREERSDPEGIYAQPDDDNE